MRLLSWITQAEVNRKVGCFIPSANQAKDQQALKTDLTAELAPHWVFEIMWL